MRAMQPYSQRFAGRAFALGDFGPREREFQILAAEVQVENFRQALSCSSRCTRCASRAGLHQTDSARKYRRRPARALFQSANSRRRIPFRIIAGNAFARAHLVEVELEQLAVVAATLIFVMEK